MREAAPGPRPRNGIATFTAIIAWSLSSSGCFVASEPFATPTPAEMSRLEVFVGEDSTDVEAVARLATGYLAEGRGEDARVLLERAHQRLPGDGTLLVMLGIVEQELGLYGTAANRYASFLETRESPFAAGIQARLDAIRGGVLRDRMRGLLEGDAIAPDVEADRRRLDPRRIVVLPFAHAQEEPGLEAVATALTWIVGRDLDAFPFQVVDRAVARSLLEEMGVDPVGWTELTVGLEVARLLGAGHVIQGRIRSRSPGRLSWDVSVLSLRSDGRMEVAPIPAEAAMDDVIRLEAVVAELLRRSVQDQPFLPPRRTASEARASPDMAAFLAFGRGLAALNAGDYSGAQTEFEAARLLDPDFDAAGELARRAELVQEMNAIPLLTTLEEAARIGELQRAVQALRDSPGSSRQRALARVGDRERTAVPELLGLDRMGGAVLLEIVFTPSAGGGP